MESGAPRKKLWELPNEELIALDGEELRARFCVDLGVPAPTDEPGIEPPDSDALRDWFEHRLAKDQRLRVSNCLHRSEAWRKEAARILRAKAIHGLDTGDVD